MVGDRIGQEIPANYGSRFDPYLRAAEVLFVLATLQLHVDGQQALHVSAHLDQCIIARRQVSMNSDTYSGLKMGGIVVLICHFQRQGTVREEHLSVLPDTRRIDLEA